MTEMEEGFNGKGSRKGFNGRVQGKGSTEGFKERVQGKANVIIVN